MIERLANPYRSPSRVVLAALCAGLALFAPTAVQAGGLSLGWQDCRALGGAGFTGRSYGCTSSLAELPLFPALVPDVAIDSVVAVELVIDVDVATDPLPPWWRMDPGQCRANGWAADASFSGGCLDPWLGRGSGQVLELAGRGQVRRSARASK